MSKADKSTDIPEPPEAATNEADAPKAVAPPKPKARAWTAVNKLPGNQKIDARRQLPSGPLGGSGRKTNRSRSS